MLSWADAVLIVSNVGFLVVPSPTAQRASESFRHIQSSYNQCRLAGQVAPPMLKLIRSVYARWYTMALGAPSA